MRSVILAALASAASAQTYINACGGSFNLTKWLVSPPNPQAGDTVVLNATGTETGAALTGGAGTINAYLFGADVFTAPFNTCGLTQIDVLGLATGILNAPACPIAPGAQGKIGFTLPIPGEASGLGLLNIVLNASDSAGGFSCACARRLGPWAFASASHVTPRPVPHLPFFPLCQTAPTSR